LFLICSNLELKILFCYLIK